MEIWIIGGGIVLLMVYVSTRIKKSAAAAFEREIIETNTFSFVKPKGFICPVDRLSTDSFYLHSQGFGDAEATESTYQAEARLTVHDSSFDSMKSEAVSKPAMAIEEFGARDVAVRGIVTENQVEFKVFRRLVESRDSKVFDITVKVISDHLEDYQAQADEIVSSFLVK